MANIAPIDMPAIEPADISVDTSDEEDDGLPTTMAAKNIRSVIGDKNYNKSQLWMFFFTITYILCMYVMG